MQNSPQPAEVMKKLANQLFSPLGRLDCVTCFFVNGGGKRTLLKYLLQHEFEIASAYGIHFHDTLFVYVDPDEMSELTNNAYISLLLESLKEVIELKGLKVNANRSNHSSPFKEIKSLLEEIVRMERRVVFILNDFEITHSLSHSIFLNLESLMTVDKSKITYLFLSSRNLLHNDTLKSLHNLKYAVTQNVVYVPLFTREQTEYQLTQLIKGEKVVNKSKLTDLLYKLCGGHPQLTKYAFHIIRDSNLLDNFGQIAEILENNKQIQIILEDIWGFLHSYEKDILISIVKSGKLLSNKNDALDYLTKLGILRKESSDTYTVFGTLFKQFIEHTVPSEKLTINSEAAQIYYGNNLRPDMFTLQEYKLLSHLIKNEGNIVSRDQVAEIFWGKDYLDKYSDWTIDKIVSTIRKKLDSIGYPSAKLVTLKKRGLLLDQ